MIAMVDLVSIRPLMQATLAALFKFEMFTDDSGQGLLHFYRPHQAKLSSRADAPLGSSRICRIACKYSPTAAFASISPIIASLT